MVDMSILSILEITNQIFEILKNRYFLRSLRLENRLSMVWESIPVMDGQFWKKSKDHDFWGSGP